MINTNNLINLYEGVIKEDPLTTKQLQNYGFKKNDLTNLVNKNILERYKRGRYIFNDLQDLLGLDTFKELFIIILTDNGSEFSNPSEIEIDKKSGEKRTQIFYCHPSSPYEKGACEVNHEFLRRVLPKGTSFDDLTQEDINLIMSHINSYKRKKLNNCSPYQLFSFVYGNKIAHQLGIVEIDPNEINLSSDLIKKD